MSRLVYISVYDTREPEQGMYDRLLYKLLEERKPWQNISHKKMPTFSEHIGFIRSKPYKAWYLIQREMSYEFIGSVYITTQNEIVLFLFDKHQYKGYGKKILNDIMEIYCDIKEFRANIAPLNSHSLAFFSNNGFEHNRTMFIDNEQHIIQYTYTKSNPYYVNVEEQNDSASELQQDG